MFSHLLRGPQNQGFLRLNAMMYLPLSYLGAKYLSLLQRIGVFGWPKTESPLSLLWIMHYWIYQEILASIEMCSPFVHLLVSFYRKIQTLLPSLGTLMDGDPREGGDSIVCSLKVLRRLGWLSLGSLKCGINFLECALWSQKMTSATLSLVRLFEGNPRKGAPIEEKCAQRCILLWS